MTRFVVPLVVPVRPDIDAALVSTGVVRLIDVPAYVVHGTVRGSVFLASVLSPGGTLLPHEHVQVSGTLAISGRPQIESIAGPRVALTVPVS